MMNQLLHMYKGNSWIQTPGAPTAPEMWSEPSLGPSLSQGLRPVPEKFLMHGVDV